MLSRQRPRRTNGTDFRAAETPSSEALNVTVLFTTVKATLHAFRRATNLAFDLGASTRVLLLHQIPYPLPLEQPRVPPDFHARQFYGFWNGESIPVKIDIRLCRDRYLCVSGGLRANSLVVIGAPNTWWPFTQEKRMTRFLRRRGHQVIVATLPAS